MSANEKQNVAIVGVGVVACAVCCAGPILAVLAAIGFGTAVGFALFGAVAIVVGAVLVAFVMVRRRRRATACATIDTPEAVSVQLTEMRPRSETSTR